MSALDKFRYCAAPIRIETGRVKIMILKIEYVLPVLMMSKIKNMFCYTILYI